MTTTTLRPTSSSASPGIGGAISTTGGTHEAVTSDNNNGTYSQLTSGAAFQDFEGYESGVTYLFTLPAGSVYSTRRGRVTAQGIDAGRMYRYAAGGQMTTINAGTFGDVTSPYTSYPQAYGTVFPLTQPYVSVHSYGQSAVLRIAEVYLDITYFGPPSAPSAITPSTTWTTSLRPTFTWTHNDPTTGGTQFAFQVRVFTTAQAAIGGFDPTTSPATLDSGVIDSTVSAWAATSDLINGGGYKTYVRTYNGLATDGTYPTVRTTPSAWASQTFTMAIPVPVPTNLVPGTTTQNTSRPALNADVAAMANGVQIRRQWDLATNSGFTTGLLTITEPTYATTKSSPIAFPDLPTRLAQGTWFMRARTQDIFGNFSAYTTTQSFTVTHPPTTGYRSPGAGASLVYNTGTNAVSVSWLFQDIDVEDFQLKYEAELWKAADPVGSLKTTGVITSAAQTASFTTLNGTWKDTELRWRIRVYDQDNVAGPWSTDQAFFLRDVATVNITLPTEGQVISTATPTVTWTFFATGGRTLASSRLVIQRTSTGSVLVDTGVMPGAILSYTVPSPVILVGPTYTATVTVVDSSGLTSVEANNFTASYSLPPTPSFTIDSSDFAQYGRLEIDWTTSTVSGTNLGWRIYRRQRGYSAWKLIAETDSLIKHWSDFTTPSFTNMEFAVVQVADNLGAPVESAYPIVEFYGETTDYMLVVPDNPSYNLILYHVTDDEFEDEQEMATTKLIGRGRRVEYGTRFGQTGSLTAEFRDNAYMSGRSQRLLLEAIRDSGYKVYLRNPFGDVWAVALDSARISRVAGVGLQEMATASISYTEITA